MSLDIKTPAEFCKYVKDNDIPYVDLRSRIPAVSGST